MQFSLLSLRIIFLSTLLCFAFHSTLSAQAWLDGLTKSEQQDFYAIQRNFNSYWQNRKPQKGQGYKPYKRWEWFWASRVDKQGHFPKPAARWDAHQYSVRNLSPAHTTYRRNDHSSNTSETNFATQAASWTCLGPFTSPGGYTGNGRLNSIGFHPTQVGNYYVGAPAGGLWHTTDDGQTWTTTTDLLPSLGVSAIVVDWSNPQVVYLGSGDGDGSDTQSLGVLKSTDGGLTWSTTGLSWTPSQFYQVNRMIQDPVNPNILMAATNDGTYRTTDGGNNWTQSDATAVRDIEMKPGDPNTWYVASYRNSSDVEVLRTTNAGASWSVVYTNSNSNRINIAVTPDNPNLVALLSSEDGSNGLDGLFKSTNSGASGSFTQVFSGTTANILDYTDDGSGSGGQGWYDLSFEIDPNNENNWYSGGVNIWKSTDAGQSWNCKTMWYNFQGLAEVHADQHFFSIQPNRPNHLFACNDGGLFVTTDGGDNWAEITHLQQGPVIGQYYRISNHFYNEHEVLGGLQDNGSKLLRNGTWIEATGGDGMECIIDPVDTLIMYGSYTNGSISRSNDGGQSFSTYIAGNLPNPDNGAWVTPYCLDPDDHNTIYIAYDEVYKSTDNGDNFTTISTGIPTGTAMQYLEVCQANSNRIYTGTHNDVYRTLNGGASWTNITPSTHVGSFTYMTSDPLNADRIWLANSSYSSSIQVYYSSNGGTTWNDYSGSLPDVAVNTIIYQNGTDDGLYIGTDIGVYYTDNSMTDWVYYNSGLPVVVVSELEIHYSSGKLRAATYGRGVWESPLYVSNLPGAPAAGFSSSATTVCAGYAVNFTDQSLGNPVSWHWTFPGATPSTSTLQNPMVSYQTPGTYNVSLVVSNPNGTSYVAASSYIIVQFTPTSAAIYTGNPCMGDSIQLIGGTLSGATYSWSGPSGFNSNQSSVSLTGLTLNQTGVYSFVISYQGCLSLPALVNLTVVPYPAAPINVASNSPLCLPAALQLSCAFSGGGNAVWTGPSGFNSTTQNPTVSNPSSGTYSVYVSNLGCGSPIVQLGVVVFPQPAKPVITQLGNILSSSGISGNQWYRNGILLPGETNQAIDCSLYGSGDYTVKVTDGNNCPSEVSDKVTLVFALTDPEVAASGFEIRPNPFQNYFEIHSIGESPMILKSIEILDVRGRRVLLMPSILQAQVGVSTESFIPGIYLLVVESAEGKKEIYRLIRE